MELKDIKLTPLLETLRLEKISDKVYFSEKYSNYVSNSRLGLINPRQMVLQRNSLLDLVILILLH